LGHQTHFVAQATSDVEDSLAWTEVEQIYRSLLYHPNPIE
jgi:hypothetical protein